MVPDVSTGDYTRMFCLNCARRIVSPKSNTKYSPFTSYLKFRAGFTDTVKLSFAKIDGIMGENLPMTAYREEKWWNNSPDDAHTKAWLNAGWNVQEVNLKEGYVVFKKVKEVQARSFKRKTAKSQAPALPAIHPYTALKHQKAPEPQPQNQAHNKSQNYLSTLFPKFSLITQHILKIL